MSPRSTSLLLSSVLLISIFGTVLFTDPNWSIALPLSIFYLILVLNTYFSVAFFLEIVPRENVGQKLIDAVLVISFIIMAFFVSHALVFMIICTAFFIVATCKYIHLSRITHYPKLLKRKIRVDTLGVLLCLLILAGVMFGYEIAGLWAFVIIFAIANIWVLVLSPLYKRID